MLIKPLSYSFIVDILNVNVNMLMRSKIKLLVNNNKFIIMGGIIIVIINNVTDV